MGAEEEEGAQEEVAETGLLGDDGAQVVGGDGQHGAWLADDGGEVGHLAGEQIELADDLALLADAEAAAGLADRLDQLDLPLEDDEEIAGGIALAEEMLPGRDRPDLAAAAEDGDLVLRQLPERRAQLHPFDFRCHGACPPLVVASAYRNGGDRVSG